METTWNEKLNAQQLTELGLDILKACRNDLYLSMRYLDVALSGLEITPLRDIQGIGTDGSRLYYEPGRLIAIYRQGPQAVSRAYLHLIFHCLFCHIYPQKKREPTYWNLACDIAAEYTVDSLHMPCVHQYRSAMKLAVYRELEQLGGVITAERVYGYLAGKGLKEQELARLAAEFFQDDHRYWQQDAPPSQTMNQREKWDSLREKTQARMEQAAKEAADGQKTLEEQLRLENRERYDYREFLKKFSVLKEEMQVDLDAFDYIFYNYGMEVYGNMPLIEPLETKEVRKIEDFVIVIDTSMSCKGHLVQKFLDETYSVLSEAESFARRIRIHLIQCDDKVQEDKLITSRQEMEDYLAHFTVRGLGGTDFRPAFAYVEDLRASGAFTHLRGLIYFTDGYGRFPVRKPDYDTAFVFMKEDYQDVDVPPWAIKLILDSEDMQEIGENSV